MANYTKEEHLQILNESLHEEYQPQIRKLEDVKEEYETALNLPYEEKTVLVVKSGEEEMALLKKEEERIKLEKKNIIPFENIVFIWGFIASFLGVLTYNATLVPENMSEVSTFYQSLKETEIIKLISSSFLLSLFLSFVSYFIGRKIKCKRVGHKNQEFW